MDEGLVKRLTCLVYGEGAKDKKFLIRLIHLPKFKYHTSKWHFNYGNASGGSAKDVLKQCNNESVGYDYDLKICFVDLDKLKEDFPKKWLLEKEKLEKDYKVFGIHIVWQLDNAEEEYVRVLGRIKVGKHKLNKIARSKVNEFINSNFWKRILKVIKDREKQLSQ